MTESTADPLGAILAVNSAACWDALNHTENTFTPGELR